MLSCSFGRKRPKTKVEQAAKPKKEYLTEKKLKQKIDDADNEIADLLAPYGGDEVKFTLGALLFRAGSRLAVLQRHELIQRRMLAAAGRPLRIQYCVLNTHIGIGGKRSVSLLIVMLNGMKQTNETFLHLSLIHI